MVSSSYEVTFNLNIFCLPLIKIFFYLPFIESGRKFGMREAFNNQQHIPSWNQTRTMWLCGVHVRHQATMQ